MKPRTATALVATGFLALVPLLPAGAQTSRLHIGPRIGYNFDAEELTVGGQLSVPIGQRLEFYPSIDIHTVDQGSLTSFNLDLKLRMPPRSMGLYVGGGLGILHRSVGDTSRDDTGLNLLVGAESLRGRAHPFVEGRVTLSDGSTVLLVGGLNITI